MKRIKKISEHIMEEVKGAKAYAEKYIEMRIDQDDRAAKFKEMAQDELRHAMILHEMAVEMIERARTVMDPPEEMVDKWQNTHAEYVRCVDDVKSMLNIV